MAVRIALCGPLAVETAGAMLSGASVGTRKARLLLGLLAREPGTPVASDHLAELLWDGRPPRDPDGNLATLVSRLRKVVGEAALVATPPGYALVDCVTDVEEATALRAEAAARLDHGEPSLAVAAARRATDLLGRGPVLLDAGEAAAAPLRRRVADLERECRHLLSVAARRTGEHALARTAALAAVDADRYDERAHRDLMWSDALSGNPSAALATYQELATRLREDLGVDPEQRTRRLQVAVLRGEDLTAAPDTSTEASPPGLVGREPEMAVVDRRWLEASAGRPTLLLVSGPPGIGKTRLLIEAEALVERSGGRVLRARCHPGERSIFLQPVVQGLRPLLLGLGEPELRRLIGPHADAWTWLVPEVSELLGTSASPGSRVSPALARRRAFDAVLGLLTGLAARQPVLLTVDDLQYAGTATADLLGFLRRGLGPAPVLVVAAARSDALPGLAALAEVAWPVSLGPLSAQAVGSLADRAGLAGHAEALLDRTNGHTLSVVESLRALADGAAGVPDSFAASIRSRMAGLDDPARRVLEAAAVLARLEPSVLAGLVVGDPVDVALRCERLVEGGFLVRQETSYAFVNDLVQEAVLRTLSAPVAAAYHRRAADLLSDQPESMAGHAEAAGDRDRAARGWLLAGRAARHRAALDDAVALLDRALGAATEPELEVRIRLERARAQEARACYAEALDDAVAAHERALATGDPRLEMRARRILGGDVSVALRRPVADVVGHNEAGLRIASNLGDRVAAGSFGARLVVLAASRLQLGKAFELARRRVEEDRSAGSIESLVYSLDGLKTACAYLGRTDELARVVDELDLLLRDRRLTWLRQWAVLDSALVPASRGEWGTARRRIDEALELNRTTGYVAYAGYFRAQRGWLARLAGDLDAALDDGRRSIDDTSPVDHPWWYATAVGGYATSLLDAGRGEEAGTLCEAGLEALGPEAGEAYLLRCLAPMAAAGGPGLAEADALLRGIDAPAGAAWVAGADAYEGVARAWRSAGEPARAAAALAPLAAATSPTTWAAIHRRVAQSSSPTS